MNQHHTTTTSARLLTRGLAIAALAGIALVHLVEIPGAFGPMPVLCAMFIALTAGAVVVAAALVHADRRVLWVAAGLTAAGASGGYSLTRLVAVPFDTGDVGNWGEPLGLVSLFVQTCLLLLCGYRLLILRDLPARIDQTGPATRSVSSPG
ncbi:hypothetical protein [Leekyejoonella antrihumi]|uniref:Uncharacterized protein n=1 Tax=Leekyejoonella antrihumi TaxID=1660198 RepID=A0A563E443_9MICO|nr:hypothetical protein [Leekyejoonella antrihumi]TWP37298.1 hypothetical protein FGL98_05940 [Leekyejoonella antrihumi]